MTKLGQNIHTNSLKYKVYAVAVRDLGTTRISVEVYIVSPKGEISDIHTISRKNFIAGKNSLNFLLDLQGNFSNDDLKIIHDKLKVIFYDTSPSEECTVQSKATIGELHQIISDYIRENAEDLKDNSKADIFIQGNLGFMRTTLMKDFLEKNKEELAGYKKLDIFKRLKILGALIPDASRPYDTLVSQDGEKKRFYKIELAETQEEEKEGDTANGH